MKVSHTISSFNCSLKMLLHCQGWFRYWDQLTVDKCGDDTNKLRINAKKIFLDQYLWLAWSNKTRIRSYISRSRTNFQKDIEDFLKMVDKFKISSLKLKSTLSSLSISNFCLGIYTKVNHNAEKHKQIWRNDQHMVF